MSQADKKEQELAELEQQQLTTAPEDLRIAPTTIKSLDGTRFDCAGFLLRQGDKTAVVPRDAVDSPEAWFRFLRESQDRAWLAPYRLLIMVSDPTRERDLTLAHVIRVPGIKIRPLAIAVKYPRVGGLFIFMFATAFCIYLLTTEVTARLTFRDLDHSIDEHLMIFSAFATLGLIMTVFGSRLQKFSDRLRVRRSWRDYFMIALCFVPGLLIHLWLYLRSS